MSNKNPRLRLSPEKAALISALSDDMAAKLLTVLEDGRVHELPEVVQEEVKWPAPFAGGNPDNVLVISDTHEPHSYPGYIEWCRDVQARFNCGTVVHIGDAADFHSVSQWEADPDSPSAGDELDLLKQALKKTYHIFPELLYCYGNHDLRIQRKAKSAGLSKHMVKSLADVLEAPAGWKFGYRFILNNVCYQHGGSGGDAFKYAKESRRSTVQGHLHTQSFVQFNSSEDSTIFGMQVGCGIEKEAEAFSYSQPFPKKPVIGCGVVLGNGTVPINLVMPL